jgi:hypothetical protein
MKSWELQEERKKKKILRDHEKREYLYRGFVGGIIWTEKHMVSKGREAIGLSLLREAKIDMAKCNEVKINLMDKKVIEKLLRIEKHDDYGYER